jgi:hypothetical protein
LLARLPLGAPAGAPAPASLSPVTARLRQRYPGLGSVVHVGLVNEGASTVTHVISVPGPAYRARTAEQARDFLAAGLFAGGGPRSLYLRTWAAGLAYGNGLSLDANGGRLGYFAERCPDPAETMRFVAGVVKAAVVDAVQASLAAVFTDYRGSEGFSARGAGLADDLADGLTPEVVRGWKTLLLREARAEGAAARLRERVPATVGRLLVGVGGRVSQDPAAVAVVMGPSRLLDDYQRFLRDSGEAALLPRLYPRDFWPATATEAVTAGAR